MTRPRYPIYIPSKGRHDVCQTARFLDRDGVPFRIVVEPQEQELYADVFGAARVLVLPFSNLGQGSIPARNWIKEHATASRVERHWIIDDNIAEVSRVYKQRRIVCESGPAFAAVEDFADRYENVAIAGLNYRAFVVGMKPPFNLNVHVYSCMLILNHIPHRWRGRYNEDTDLCLQVLADGWCTVLVNAFCIRKAPTMTMKGGNTDELYQGDGRLKMSRALERVWPGVVTTTRKYRRPQHHVHENWQKFDTPLRLKPDAAVSDTPNEYGLTLQRVCDVKSKALQRLVDEAKQ